LDHLFTTNTADYWELVSKNWENNHSLWRAHSDAINGSLLKHRLPEEQVNCLLKTDLFDEAVSAGLYPLLALHAKSVVGIDISLATSQAAKGRYPQLNTSIATIY